MRTISDKIVKTRKAHKCNACGRDFPKGTTMRAQVNVYDYMYIWRECPTCIELLSKYRSEFEDLDGFASELCVADALTDNQTPEDLLDNFNQKLK